MGVNLTLPPATEPRVMLWREPLRCALSPGDVLARLAGEPLPFALAGSWAGGGAIVGSCPVAVAGDENDPFAVLDRLPDLTGPAPAGAVGGGWFGWLGYRLGARVERLPAGPPRPVALPEFHLAYYDHVLRRDPAGRWWFEALATDARHDALATRLADLRRRLARPPDRGRRPGRPRPPTPSALSLSRAAAIHHLEAVADCVRRIAAGEIFQANLCLRLDAGWDGTAGELFRRSAEHLHPPFAAVFDTPRGSIASLSPELFLRRRGGLVQTGPIKGTLERAADPAVAAAARRQLIDSAKDAAEHVMIVDLMRNDLGRVCAYGTVAAARRPTAEPHPGLWHLVSEVRGTLRPGVANAELLRATFPPGSVTGAPKVQAMHVIAALEPTSREVYTGAIGFASPVAGLELSVAIRTLEMHGGRLWLGAGGGIVADSDPRRELAEALAKARPIAAAVGAAVRNRSSVRAA